MIKIRPAKERGVEERGWLSSHHTFSFNTYVDEDYMGFRALRVINEDTVKGGKGFGSHPHQDMEIITYVLEGALEHKDSLGNTSVIAAGEVQRMTAGTGIVHSEYNLSHHVPAHFLQIWIQPNQNGLPPSYSQKVFPSAAKWGQWCLMVSSNGRGGSLLIHQDADIYSTILDADEEISYDGLADRYYWLQVVSGSFQIDETTVLNAGDGAALTEQLSFTIKCVDGGELLLFDLA